MARKLSKETIDTWYERLNVLRTQAGVALASVAKSESGSTSTDVKKLITDIENTLTNSYLSSSVNTINGNNFEIGKRIDIVDFDSIDNTIIQIARQCVNIVTSNSKSTNSVTQHLACGYECADVTINYPYNNANLAKDNNSRATTVTTYSNVPSTRCDNVDYYTEEEALARFNV